MHRVHVQERDRAGCGQQRRVRGQTAQQRPGDLLDLADVPPRQAAQEHPERGRGTDVVEQFVHAAVPQHVQIGDAVGSGGHPGHDRAELRGRVHTEPIGDGDVLIHEPAQVDTLGQPHHRFQTGVGDHVLVVEARMGPGSGMKQSHVRGVLRLRILEA
ncbi:hypothetical protein GCM10027161_02460 [Microbispora hainanensis]